MVLTILLVSLLAIGAVSAQDNTTDDIVGLYDSNNADIITDEIHGSSAEDSLKGSQDADLTIDVSDIDYGQDATIGAVLPADATGSVNITVIGKQNQTFSNLSIEKGKISVVASGLAAGDYRVTASYSGDFNYNMALAYAALKVNRVAPAISVSADPIVYGDALVVNVEMSADVERRAIVTVGNESKAVSLKNGVGSVKFKGVTAGTHTIYASYNGDSNYGKACANTTVKVSRANVKINVKADNINYGEDLVVNVQLPSDVARRAIVTVDNETKLVRLTDGIGSVRFGGLSVGTHEVKVSYNGDSNYVRGNSVNKTVNVGRGIANIRVTVNHNQPVRHNESLSVKVELPNATRRVNVTIGNESKLVSLKNGTGTVEFSALDAGTHTIIASYDGDDNYVKSAVNTTLKVRKAFAVLALEYFKVVYEDMATVYIILPSDVAYRAIFTLDNNKTWYVSLKEGLATVKLTDLSVGVHDIKVEYAGDANYTPSDLTIQI